MATQPTDETAAMRARAEAFMSSWPRKFASNVEWLTDFATAEVARALAEERAKVARQVEEETGINLDRLTERVKTSMEEARSKVGPLASTGMASAGSPVCQAWCGGEWQGIDGVTFWMVDGKDYCSEQCAHAGRALNPAPNLSPGLKTDAEFKAAVVAGARTAAEPSGDFGQLKCSACVDGREKITGMLMADTVDAKHECEGDPCEACGATYMSQSDRDAFESAMPLWTPMETIPTKADAAGNVPAPERETYDEAAYTEPAQCGPCLCVLTHGQKKCSDAVPCAAVERWAAACRAAHWFEDDLLRPWGKFVEDCGRDQSEPNLWRYAARTAIDSLRHEDSDAVDSGTTESGGCDPVSGNVPAPATTGPTAARWRCLRCKAESFDLCDPSWRWNGINAEHKCPDLHPQAGHMECELFVPQGTGVGTGPEGAPAAPASHKPTQGEIDHEVEQCRAMERKFPVSRPDHTSVVVALAAERDALKARAAELQTRLMRSENAYDGAVESQIKAERITNAMRTDRDESRARVAELEAEKAAEKTRMVEYEKMGGRLAGERDQLRDRVSELLAERTAAIAEKAAAVLAERERCLAWVDWFLSLLDPTQHGKDKLRRGVRDREAAPR